MAKRIAKKTQKQQAVLKADDVIKSNNAKDSLICTNLQRFKFKIGDMTNPNTINYKSKLKRSCQWHAQWIP